MREYPKREIYVKGRYVTCQVLNPWKDEAPKYMACNPVDIRFPDMSEPFMATQRMGTWMAVDIWEVAREMNQ